MLISTSDTSKLCYDKTFVELFMYFRGYVSNISKGKQILPQPFRAPF